MKKPSNSVIIEVLEKKAGLIKPSAIALKVTRKTLYDWINSDEELKSALLDCRESIIDLVEGTLFNAVQDGDISAAIFMAKTLGKNRGYVERSELEHSGGITSFNVGFKKDEDS